MKKTDSSMNKKCLYSSSCDQSNQNWKLPSILLTGTVAGPKYKQSKYFPILSVCVVESSPKLKFRDRNSCCSSTQHDAILLSPEFSSGGHLRATRAQKKVWCRITPHPPVKYTMDSSISISAHYLKKKGGGRKELTVLHSILCTYITNSGGVNMEEQ